MLLSFSKYQGSGNDFVLIDDRTHTFPVCDAALIEKLCHRHWGIGADGLILIQNSIKGDAKMRIFNRDGKEAIMCGNGLRAAACFLEKQCVYIESLYGMHTCEKTENGIATSMGIPKKIHLSSGTCVWDTGVPHALFFVEDLGTVDVTAWGKQVRYDPAFAPHGVNVSFVQNKASHLVIRTYERGVENETLACGTGACAAAIEAHITHNMPFPIEVVPPSNISFLIDMQKEELILTGPIHKVFQGEIAI